MGYNRKYVIWLVRLAYPHLGVLIASEIFIYKISILSGFDLDEGFAFSLAGVLMKLTPLLRAFLRFSMIGKHNFGNIGSILV